MSTNMTALETVFSYFGMDINAGDTRIFLISISAALAISLLTSVLAGLAYYSHISALLIFAKPIDKKEHIAKTPSSLINRCVSEYIACGENGAPLMSVELIVRKHMLRMSFIGTNFKSLERFGKWLEIAALCLTVAAVVSTGEAGWAVIIGTLYLLYRLILLFFDAQTLNDKLFYGITTYLNREIGKLYIADDKAGMRIFKNEIHSSLMEQASILQNSINNLSRELSGIIKTSYGTLGEALSKDIAKYDDLGEKLRKPVDGLEALFGKFSISAETLNSSSLRLSESISLMEKKLGAITRSLDKNSDANVKSIENSEVLFHELRDSLKSFNAAYSSLEAELVAVKNVQSSLELSLQGYELSMQETAGKFGDAVGSIVELRGKEAAETLNDTISVHIKQFQNDTSALLEKMTALFEQNYEQNKSEIQTLLRIEETFKRVID